AGGIGTVKAGKVVKPECITLNGTIHQIARPVHKGISAPKVSTR
ncbi:unnamed protein product, partial [marine sediment metagenome]